MMTRLCEVKNKMLDVIMAQMDHLESVDVCELGEAIDIIKDIAEAEYYCSVVTSMDKSHTADAIHVTSAHDSHSLVEYLHALTDKVHTMIDTATPEEKAMMKDKMRELYQLL